MTREEVQTNLNTRDLDWLESRWSVLNEAVKKIEPHLAEIETAFHYDYTVDMDNPLEEQVCGQVLEMCNIVTTHDTENTMSWGELLELINNEIEKREAWRSDKNQKLIKALLKPLAVKGRRLEPAPEED